MTTEQKQLVLQVLCTMLPYGVKINHQGYIQELTVIVLEDIIYSGHEVKPYLRPMSSMTDKEKDELYAFINWVAAFDEAGNLIIEEYISGINLDTINRYIDWLNVHHFDYRGLIQIGLALPAKEGMYD